MVECKQKYQQSELLNVPLYLKLEKIEASLWDVEIEYQGQETGANVHSWNQGTQLVERDQQKNI